MPSSHGTTPSCSAAAGTQGSSTSTSSTASSGNEVGTGNELVLDDIALSKSSPPCQPVISGKFPTTYFSGKGRSFNPDWYKLYPWLEYSITKDAAFCYPCRLFGTYSVHLTRPE